MKSLTILIVSFSPAFLFLYSLKIRLTNEIFSLNAFEIHMQRGQITDLDHAIAYYDRAGILFRNENKRFPVHKVIKEYIIVIKDKLL